MQYFVLTYARRAGVSSLEGVYPEECRSEAMRRRFRLEAEHRTNPDLEVVVLGAESEDELHRTHARYFVSTADLVRNAHVAIPA